MSFISQRGKEYLETAQTLLRAAQTMTDPRVSGQLKALADDYERRAEKTSHADAAKALARSTARVDRDEPDRQISRIRLPDETSRRHPRHVATGCAQAYEPEVPIKVREWIGPALASKVR